MPRIFCLHVFFCLICTPVQACIDSIWTQAKPVQCKGLRNGEVEVLNVFGGQKPYYFSIDGQSFSTNPKFDHLWPGSYDVFVRDGSGCIVKFPVIVNEPPEFKVRLQASDSLVVPGKSFTIHALYAPETAAIVSISWSPTHLFVRQDTLRQTIAISKSEHFSISLSDKNGCLAEDDVEVDVEKPNYFIPNVIKPGDQQNGFFTVYAGEGVAEVNLMQIYSRSGAKLFEKSHFAPNDPLRGWNGRWNGQTVQSGVYVWLIEIQYLDGSKHRLDGTVTVVN
ncbi:MAG: gliding motility-associated C-terminal domain-containing protein [Saprospiraceae bacterium]|nr:gliding motility-associated C-terminal domain-containing protein [Saprospiraceae bacterium]